MTHQYDEGKEGQEKREAAATAQGHPKSRTIEPTSELEPAGANGNARRDKQPAFAVKHRRYRVPLLVTCTTQAQRRHQRVGVAVQRTCHNKQTPKSARRAAALKGGQHRIRYNSDT